MITLIIMNVTKDCGCTLCTQLLVDCCKNNTNTKCRDKNICSCIIRRLNGKQEEERTNIVCTTFQRRIQSLYCLIPKQKNTILYIHGVIAYALLEIPMELFNLLEQITTTMETFIDTPDCVTFVNSSSKVCLLTRSSLEGETLLNAIEKHTDTGKTASVENKTFVDIFTNCCLEKSVSRQSEEFCIHRSFSRKIMNTNSRQKNSMTIRQNEKYYNSCHDTSHLGFLIDRVISLRKRFKRIEYPTPLTVNPLREYVVFPAHGIQHTNPAFPSYPTQVSEDNGHFEVMPSFTSLAHRNGGEVAGNRTEEERMPLTENQNHDHTIGPHLNHPNHSQSEEATNTSTCLRDTHLRSTNSSGGNRQPSAQLPANAPSEPRPPARHPDYRDYYPRLLSFTNWPGYARHDPTHLCQCGFFYTGNADLVRCFQCGIGLKDFRQDDVPLVEHVRYSPDCHFLLEILGHRQLAEYKRKILEDNANQGTFHQQQPYQCQVPNVGTPYQYNAQQPQITTPYGNVPHHGPNELCSTAMSHTYVTNQQYTTATSQQELQKQVQHGPIPPITAAGVTYRHPEYALLDTRLASFAKWPPGIMQTPRQIAEAGFYYTGMGDVVRCWACDGGLQKWDPQDDPWVEHCYYFPTCPYAIQQKGSGYIALVQQHVMINTPGKGHEHVATNSSVAQKSSSTSGINDDLQKMTIEEHDPVLSTLAAKSLKEMGYDKKQIKLAIEKLRSQGTTDPTAEQIVDIIEGEVENIPTNNNNQSTEMHRSTSEVFHENERLKSLLLCMSCNENNVNVLFLPCTHHRMCTTCAKTVTQCPLCNRFIQEKVKTYMS